VLISQTAEYALRAMVWLAGRPDRSQTTDEIAHGTQVPRGYLSKVLQALARHGLVVSQRGLGGGFTLARLPNEITTLDVLRAVDPPMRIDSCPLGLKEHRDELCPLHKSLDRAMALVENAFAEGKLSDLVGTHVTPPNLPQRRGRTRPLPE
jgi:Rrf2 family transcriptional regulator, nitric oxide-sensitive transcriptional repressor